MQLQTEMNIRDMIEKLGAMTVYNRCVSMFSKRQTPKVSLRKKEREGAEARSYQIRL